MYSPVKGRLPLRLVWLLAAGLALGACDSTSNPFGDDAGTPKAAASIYCYSTIGEEDCHDRPLPDESGRLIGYEGPPPPSRDEI